MTQEKYYNLDLQFYRKKLKNVMITGNNGVSYYYIGNRYYKNSGWFREEIDKWDWLESVIRIEKELKEEE